MIRRALFSALYLTIVLSFVFLPSTAKAEERIVLVSPQGPVFAGHEGTIYSFQLTSRLFEEKLNLTAEYSMSDFDEDTSDDIDSAIFLAAGGRRRPLPLPSLSPGCGGDV
jgi:hypothetical protein